MAGLGHTRWAFADGYIPAWSNGPDPEFVSHEALCVLNAGPRAARLHITVFFSERDPLDWELEVPPQRTLHQRFNDLHDPQIPPGLGYSCVVESDQPVVVQQTRLDSRQNENALLSTIAFPDPHS